MVNGNPEAFSGVYNFLHNETPNFPGPVNDVVSFLNNISQLGTFDIGGVDYTIGLLGFKTSPNGPLLSQFSTVEGQSNSAFLYAQISRPNVFVPEPENIPIDGWFSSALCLYSPQKAGCSKSLSLILSENEPLRIERLVFFNPIGG